jgi:hypothetical protein
VTESILKVLDVDPEITFVDVLVSLKFVAVSLVVGLYLHRYDRVPPSLTLACTFNVKLDPRAGFAEAG